MKGGEAIGAYIRRYDTMIPPKFQLNGNKSFGSTFRGGRPQHRDLWEYVLDNDTTGIAREHSEMNASKKKPQAKELSATDLAIVKEIIAAISRTGGMITKYTKIETKHAKGFHASLLVLNGCYKGIRAAIIVGDLAGAARSHYDELERKTEITKKNKEDRKLRKEPKREVGV